MLSPYATMELPSVLRTGLAFSYGICDMLYVNHYLGRGSSFSWLPYISFWWICRLISYIEKWVRVAYGLFVLTRLSVVFLVGAVTYDEG